MIWNYPNWGGAQIYFLSIVRNAPKGWKMRLVLPRGVNSEVTKFFEPYGVEIDYLRTTFVLRPVSSLKEKIVRQWQRIRSEAEIYIYSWRKLSANSVIHIEAGPWQSWIILFLLSLRFNTIVTVHNSLPVRDSTRRSAIWKWRMNFLMRMRRFQIFGANQNAVDSLRTYIQPRYWEKITLTRAAINPIEIAAVLEVPLDRDELLRRNGLPTDRFIILCVGQFIDRKGRWVFVEAAKRARVANNDLFFVWIGPDAPDDGDLARIAEYQVDGWFKYIVSSSLGAARSDVLTFFRLADVFVLASFLEGLPISIIEAMGLGLPVISTNIGAIPEAITDARTGLLVEAGDIDALTAAIDAMRTDEVMRRGLATAGQAFAMQTFDERNATSAVFERYAKAVN